MRKNKVYAYNTHYEIYDYNLGDWPEMERALTYWDRPTFTSFPKYLYDKVNHQMFIPRGFDPTLIEQWNGKPITYVDNDSHIEHIGFSMTKDPKDSDQEKAIRFLVGLDEFKSIKNNSQKVLIMSPGKGKTYCAVSAIQRLHMRAIVIVHTQNLREQWVERLTEYTSMGGPNIVEITSSKQLHGYMKKVPNANCKIFITTRNLLVSYCDRYGIDALSEVIDKMGIGVKVLDEVHKEYERTLLIDYATNVKFTFYLTATFALSDYMRNKIFQNAFDVVKKLHIKMDESARHVIYIPVIFNSHPNLIEEQRIVERKRGLDRFLYIEYELNKGILEKELRSMLKFFLVDKGLSGKSLILSSKKVTCDAFKDIAENEVNFSKKVCSFHTDNKIQDYKEYDIISATAQMLGTGEDIPGLRFMYNTEPFASLPNTDQFSGRLRPYEDETGVKPTYYIEFIDIGFEKVYDWYKKRLKLLKTKVKEIHEMNHTIIR